MQESRYWLALKQVPGIGNLLFKRLIEVYKTPEAVFDAAELDLAQVEGLSLNLAKAIHVFDDFDVVDRELEALEKASVSLLTLGDPTYPARLLAIYDPPPVLYVKGILLDGNRASEDEGPTIAVVGTRKTTAYGRRVTDRLSQALSEQGVTIVSGFARGVDSIAHRAALNAGGQTIAVLGCGLDCIYPPEHKKLYQDINERGLIVSEFPLGTPPVAHNFPKRNRIISGLSLGCLVVEAGLKSGSLITARLAMEQGREVFAVPGAIDSVLSAGPHQLIASGAKLVQTVGDILVEILPQHRSRPLVVDALPLPRLEPAEVLVFETLSFEPKHIDVLIQESKRPASSISGVLLTLELKGLARQMAGQYYVKV
ncbi:MAG: DNA-processing protein DprA [Nitrospirota bacterium]|nr:DNA-processing protein DprA [Nitrospirota bacterium]